MSKLFKKVLGKSRNENKSVSPPTVGSQPALAPPEHHDSRRQPPIPSAAPVRPLEKIGLFELSSEDGEKTVDVVAVHGLQGDAYETWEHENGSLWLRDFLPVDVPFARIMTFGYDSTVAFSRSVAKIEDKALELLNRLSRKRCDTQGSSARTRPIVFVCHSLGGIVVKKALILAHERSSDPEYKQILDSTKGIAFLGVPHKGFGASWWANFAANALKAAGAGTSTNTSLVSDLRRDSTTLTDISKQFIGRTAGLRIYTFYETQKLFGVVVCWSREIGRHHR